MDKCCIYLRVSGRSQIEKDGFTRQLLAARSYAAAHNLQIVRVFREEGISGSTESTDRPAFAEMLSTIYGSNGTVRTIVIEKLDRLARNLLVQEAAIADLTKHGITLLSVMEPDLMASDPTRILMRQLVGAIAQYDKSQLVLKLRGSRIRMRASMGRCEGAKPFGFFEGESAVLDRMRQLRGAGLGCDRIAATLRTEGIKTRKGTDWHPYSVSRILLRGEAR